MKCNPTPEAKRLLRAMAKAQLEMGVTDAHAIVDAIHARIADFAPMDKGEIADVISGFGQKAEKTLTKPELQQRMGQLKKELRAAFHGSTKDATRQAAIKKEIARIEEQLKSGNFSKATRAKPEYDAKTQALQADLERARTKADMAMRKLQYQSKSKLYRATTLALNIGRAFILSSPTVFAHLAGASFWRLMGTLVEDTAGAAWRLVPKFSEIDQLAMVEGGGFQAGAHAAGLKAAFSKQTLKDIKDKLLKGQSDRQALYGKKGEYWTPHPMLEVMGHIHDSIKTPIENYAFERAITRVATNTRARMVREGMSADAIDKAFTTNTLQTQMAAMAYAESQAAKLQGANKLVDWINETFGRMDRSGAAGQGGSALLRSQMPIVRIPTNLVKEGVELVAGVPMGLVKGFLADVSKMAPADADKIMRLLKKGTIGPALLAIGWYGYEHMGGLYREGHKPPNRKEGYGDIGPLSHHWLHAPIGDVAQMGALAHYVYNEDQTYGRKHHDPHSGAESALQAIVQAGGAFAFNIPLIEGPKALVEATHGGKGLQHWEGAMARQYLEPGALQFAARQSDTDAAGETVKRYPRNLAQELEMGIPGHGLGPIPGRKDVPTKPPRLRR
jgi:hypothetical protein